MKEQQRPYRPLSLASRLWVAVDMIFPPCANQIFFEGAGGFRPEQWKAAVEKAGNANPGTRLVLRGWPGSYRWVDSGIAPPVREVDAGSWDGLGSEGAPFLEKSFPARKGPTCEVLLMHGNPARVAFRSHHAIMDGLGTATWAEDVFRVLRGEEPIGAEYISVETDLLNLQKGKRSKPLPHQYIAPTGKAEGGDIDLVWRRKTLVGKFPKLLPRLMLLAAKEAWRYAEGKVRIGVPVDLRYRREGFRSTGNLANALYLDIGKDSTVDSIIADMDKKLTTLSDGEITWEDRAANLVPFRLLGKAILMEGSRNQRSGHYRCSGLISNGGRLDVDKFSCEGFTAATLYGIPASASFIPFSMSMAGTKNGIEVLLRMPRNMANGGRLQAMLDNIERGLAAV